MDGSGCESRCLIRACQVPHGEVQGRTPGPLRVRRSPRQGLLSVGALALHVAEAEWRCSSLLPDDVDRDLHRRNRSSVLKPVCGVPVLGPAYSRPIVRRDSISMVGDRSLQYVNGAWSVFMVVNRAEDASRLDGHHTIRSWRPAMPSISRPRSTVASNFTETPFVSGGSCSLLIVLSSLYF